MLKKNKQGIVLRPIERNVLAQQQTVYYQTYCGLNCVLLQRNGVPYRNKTEDANYGTKEVYANLKPLAA